MRLVIGAILPLCSVRAYPYVDEWAESDAPSTRAVLPDAVDALVPALRDRGPRAASASSPGEDDERRALQDPALMDHERRNPCGQAAMHNDCVYASGKANPSIGDVSTAFWLEVDCSSYYMVKWTTRGPKTVMCGNPYKGPPTTARWTCTTAKGLFNQEKECKGDDTDRINAVLKTRSVDVRSSITDTHTNRVRNAASPAVMQIVPLGRDEVIDFCTKGWGSDEKVQAWKWNVLAQNWNDPLGTGIAQVAITAGGKRYYRAGASTGATQFRVRKGFVLYQEPQQTQTTKNPTLAFVADPDATFSKALASMVFDANRQLLKRAAMMKPLADWRPEAVRRTLIESMSYSMEGVREMGVPINHRFRDARCIDLVQLEDLWDVLQFLLRRSSGAGPSTHHQDRDSMIDPIAMRILGYVRDGGPNRPTAGHVAKRTSTVFTDAGNPCVKGISAKVADYKAQMGFDRRINAHLRDAMAMAQMTKLRGPLANDGRFPAFPKEGKEPFADVYYVLNENLDGTPFAPLKRLFTVDRVNDNEFNADAVFEEVKANGVKGLFVSDADQCFFARHANKHIEYLGFDGLNPLPLLPRYHKLFMGTTPTASGNVLNFKRLGEMRDMLWALTQSGIPTLIVSNGVPQDIMALLAWVGLLEPHYGIIGAVGQWALSPQYRKGPVLAHLLGKALSLDDGKIVRGTDVPLMPLTVVFADDTRRKARDVAEVLRVRDVRKLPGTGNTHQLKAGSPSGYNKNNMWVAADEATVLWADANKALVPQDVLDLFFTALLPTTTANPTTTTVDPNTVLAFEKE